jgi:hypothetical protein
MMLELIVGVDLEIESPWGCMRRLFLAGGVIEIDRDFGLATNKDGVVKLY